MRRFNFNNEISQVDNLKKSFEKFKNHACIFIEALKNEYEHREIAITTQHDNSFEFKFWGLKFITKTEISFDKEAETFKNGELNTYLVEDEEQKQIISYAFDSIGNIGNGCLENDFADLYYHDFINKLIEFTNEHSIKFQLK